MGTLATGVTGNACCVDQQLHAGVRPAPEADLQEAGLLRTVLNARQSRKK
jgi:hypothetical protein